MKTVLLIAPLLALGCLVAGLYGMVHNQLSYTVSPDYFHQFKFIQFRIDPAWQNRIGASLVGWHASWWMGLLIGLFIVPIGTIVPGTRGYVVAVLRAYGIVALTALAVGLGALAYAHAALDPTTVGVVTRFDRPITDPVAFMRAGTMHNFSYLGGLLGIATGAYWLTLERSWSTAAQPLRTCTRPRRVHPG